MEILPAIDLKDGCAVRLEKGLMNSAKIYSDKPYMVAKTFERLGSNWLHLVDLDGAFGGEPKNFDAIKKIAAKTNLNIELGGGIRNEDTIKMYKDLGVHRFILGSIALRDPKFVEEMAKKYRIVVGIDAMDGKVAVEGWADVSDIRATDMAKKFADVGVESIICTDISKDGMLSGLNMDFTLDIANASGLDTIASGGVKDIEDIKNVKEKNLWGVIVGKAYYEKTLNLEEAFKIANKGD
ncbi:MAG: Phosphoribosylformimino-5-aminoimidazole carboxamide ribotide isomerase (EC [uncultured Campylobacterales bacterium]|uniref:1-(5-phosphoribosyl)-5-[(5-phosphoribosylamino)methylideneamino] imidazole-4-carboxamide isomerase n=1 Tax=uncultured Campylobacterales bacterium TaxID=352960 RepID=A0A6S6SZU6_9BACT|nr:MAG: Phosphoribosylformimino-5-aminoimidazole carboxamide ribotide isomerase (EC [uncultured Campylobacterales bacterium]